MDETDDTALRKPLEIINYANKLIKDETTFESLATILLISLNHFHKILIKDDSPKTAILFTMVSTIFKAIQEANTTDAETINELIGVRLDALYKDINGFIDSAIKNEKEKKEKDA